MVNYKTFLFLMLGILSVNSTSLALSTNQKPVLDVYKGYLDGKVFITTKDITEKDALANCQLNAKNNSKNKIYCTWGQKIIFDNRQVVVAPTPKPSTSPAPSTSPSTSPAPAQALCALFKSANAKTADGMVATPNPANSVADTDKACVDYCSFSNPKVGYVCKRGDKIVKVWTETDLGLSSLEKRVTILEKKVEVLSQDVKQGDEAIKKSLDQSITAVKAYVDRSIASIKPSTPGLGKDEINALVVDALNKAQLANQQRLIASERRACRSEFKVQNPGFRNLDCSADVVSINQGLTACLPGAKVGDLFEVSKTGLVSHIEKASDAKSGSFLAECKAKRPNVYGFSFDLLK